MTGKVLEVEKLVVGYGGRPVLTGIDVHVNDNEVLCLIGHNGAGKSTLLKSIFGLVPHEDGRIFFNGREAPKEPRAMTMAGMSIVPEGRGVFPGMTVEETMSLGMWAAGVPEKERMERIDWVLSILPVMKKFYKSRAGDLSGGQQQMVSIGRALLSRPRCLLMDEPSIGLAPKLFQDLCGPIRELQQKTGMSILLVEQNVKEALRISDRVVVMKSGQMTWEGLPADLSDNKKLMELY
ncbi:ABC transporter ATP-binding protein [Marinobacter sp.]|uniref:ABC transporter ATP-binding protein n=1 Tax=Marinobacter sp. TaxID=50741 RepID=UPI000C35014F|nr:ABC transporter ATP-binding protein [Marinobacter sp.]MBE97372.1 ABC transporter ATP-binding protein [Marinobacter sp.]|tara:strand:+ start:720 stop:1430 length:711 start_codon:yes stop_codon:yes gene_type:complete